MPRLRESTTTYSITSSLMGEFPLPPTSSEETRMIYQTDRHAAQYLQAPEDKRVRGLHTSSSSSTIKTRGANNLRAPTSMPPAPLQSESRGRYKEEGILQNDPRASRPLRIYRAPQPNGSMQNSRLPLPSIPGEKDEFLQGRKEFPLAPNGVLGYEQSLAAYEAAEKMSSVSSRRGVEVQHSAVRKSQRGEVLRVHVPGAQRAVHRGTIPQELGYHRAGFQSTPTLSQKNTDWRSENGVLGDEWVPSTKEMRRRSSFSNLTKDVPRGQPRPDVLSALQRLSRRIRRVLKPPLTKPFPYVLPPHQQQSRGTLQKVRHPK